MFHSRSLSFALILSIVSSTIVLPVPIAHAATTTATYSHGLFRTIGNNWAFPITYLLPITVTDDFPIVDLDVLITEEDSNISHFTMSLLAPDGTEVTLFSRNNLSGDLVDVTFDDDAAESIIGSTNPRTGLHFRPQGSLDSLNLSSVQGTWNLKILNYVSAPSYTNNGKVKWTLIASGATPATIEGRVFTDVNVNGVHDAGEETLENETVYLDQNNNSMLDAGEVSTATDGSGLYQFTDLPIDDYKVRMVLSNDRILITPVGEVHTIRPANGETLSDIDFPTLRKTETAIATYSHGFSNIYLSTRPPSYKNLFIVVTDDFPIADLNVLINEEDSNISKLTVSLLAPDGTEISLFNKSDIGGHLENVTFDDDAAESIIGSTNPRTGLHFRSRGTLDNLNLSSVQGTWTLKILSYIGGSPFSTNGRIEWKLIVEGATPATIEGRVFTDANVNGVHDTGEETLENETVYLDQNNNSMLDAGEVSTTTDGSGLYQFVDIPLDDYKVRMVLSNDRILITPVGEVHTIRPANGETLSDIDFPTLRKTETAIATYSHGFSNIYLSTRPPSYKNLFIVVTDDFPIADLNVLINEEDSNISKLTVSLLAPDGTEISLFNKSDIGGHLENVTFDDDAAESIIGSTNPRTGLHFRSRGTLDNLNLSSVQGTWTLKILSYIGGSPFSTNGRMGWELQATKSIPLQSDIAISSPVLTENSTLSFAYETTAFDDPFTVSIFRSADEVLDASDTSVLNQTLNLQGSGTGSFTLDNPDANKPFILIVADPEDVVTESDDDNNMAVFNQDILEWYSPILHIFDSDFRPKEVAAMIDESSLWDGNGILPMQMIADPSTITLLESTNRDSDDFMDLKNAEPGGNPTVPDVSRFDQYQTAIYGRSFVANSGNNVENLSNLEANTDYQVLQYWFFYPYNDFVFLDIHGITQQGNRHEGDWEMIQIIIDQLSRNPIYSTYSWHWGGSTNSWEELTLNGSHPNVFVGKGGHASWKNEGVNFYKFTDAPNVVSLLDPRGDIAPTLLDENRTELHSIISDHDCFDGCEPYSLLAIPLGDRNETNDWNSFPGKWGEKGSVLGTSGPETPQFVSYGTASNRWSYPITWSNSPNPSGWDVIANSPVNLSIFDSQGRRVGALENGEIQADIPGTYYFSSSDGGPEWVTIFTDDELTFVLEGTDTGTMDFSATRFGPDIEEPVQVNFDDVLLTASFVGVVESANDTPSSTMLIDSDGDGDIDTVVSEGAFLTLTDAILALPDTAFRKKHGKGKNAEHGRKKLLKEAEKVEKEMSKDKYKNALKHLKKLQKELNKIVIDVPAEEGEATKSDVERLITLLTGELELLADEQHRAKKEKHHKKHKHGRGRK